MNLYEFSQQNNIEVGVLVLKDKEPDLFKNLEEEAKRIIRSSATAVKTDETAAPSGLKRTGYRPPEKKSEESGSAPAGGACCIRDQEPIPFNPDRPYCESCFRSWNRYKDPDYEEKYCHLCGKRHKASMAKPLCRSCYQKAVR